MKVLIDTNVLVSAALRDRLPEEIILFVARHPEIEWIASPAIIVEYKEVLARRRFGLSPELLNRWYSLLDALTIVVDVNLSVDFPRDQGDSKFLACAIVTEADFLVTGDRDFNDARRLLNTIILSIGAFKQTVIDA